MTDDEDATIWLLTEAAEIMRAVWEERDDHVLDAPDFLATVLANHWSQRHHLPPINEEEPPR